MATGKKLHDLSLLETDTGIMRVFINGVEILGVEKLSVDYMQRGKKVVQIVNLSIVVNSVEKADVNPFGKDFSWKGGA